jgi:type III restriction enzyme
MKTPALSSIIQKTPDVLGEEARIRDTRIAVWMLAQQQRFGFADTQILSDYIGTLSQDDLKAAWQYRDEHPEEMRMPRPMAILFADENIPSS